MYKQHYWQLKVVEAVFAMVCECYFYRWLSNALLKLPQSGVSLTQAKFVVTTRECHSKWTLTGNHTIRVIADMRTASFITGGTGFYNAIFYSGWIGFKTACCVYTSRKTHPKLSEHIFFVSNFIRSTCTFCISLVHIFPKFELLTMPHWLGRCKH